MHILINYPTQITLCLSFTILIFYGFLVTARRLFFHPLSEFPGPRMAAITSFYRTYYEIAKCGDFLQQIHRLHAVHGPVVRIGPNELHFNDCHAYFDIYCVGSHLTKDPTFYSCFAVGGSTFGAVDPHISKARRALMNSFFSRRSVLSLEGLIQQKVELLVSKIKDTKNAPINMFLAFRSATLDIITSYMFGHCLDALDYPNFGAPLVMDIQAALPLLWVVKAFPWMIPVLSILPGWLGGHLQQQSHAFLSIKKFAVCGLDRTKRESGTSPDSNHFTIFHRLLNASTKLCGPAHSTLDEALSLLQAGSDTVGNTCTVGLFYVLNDDIVHARLIQELRSMWPDQSEPVSLSKLQDLPYLTAVIKEALRLSHGIITPLPRVVGSTGARIGGCHIPPSTVVGMSVTSIHLNSTLFPNPTSFAPERWLGPSSRELGRYLVPFSAGPRMCLGISVAWAELYCFFGHIFRKLDMQIVDTTVEDFRDFKDFFAPLHEGRHLHISAAETS
ncbi:cytochrome P450 [Flammula alnicola]|nr:cytochrome P450 [Flammula alnicola]